MANVQPALSFNTAVSFVTNTNWQSYAGETTLSHLTQMVGLTVQNFVSAAVGHGGDGRADPRARPAPGSARSATSGSTSSARRSASCCRSRSCSRSCSLATGVIQNTHGFTDVHTVAGATQKIPGGPNASHGVDQAARHERRRLLQRQLRAPVLEPDRLQRLPRALRDPRSSRSRSRSRSGGWSRTSARATRCSRSWSCIWLGVQPRSRSSPRSSGNPKLDARGVTQTVTATSPGGNARGQGGALRARRRRRSWCASTTGTSNGSVNSMHDSYTPLGGMTCLVHMKLGEISPGGVGVGLNGLLVLVILAVFIAGLMVGRTPEYLGKKIQAAEVKLVVLYILVDAGASCSSASRSRRSCNRCRTCRSSTRARTGSPSCSTRSRRPANNNGSAFAGLTANTGVHEHRRSASRCCSAASS